MTDQPSVTQTTPTSQSPSVTWKFVCITQQSATCENCGHAIHNVFHIISSEGTTREVGSECVISVLSPDQTAQAKTAERRLTRAMRQWREQKPVARPNETRDEYIARRLNEMGHAQAAFHAALSTDFFGISNREYRASKTPMADVFNRLHAEIEQKYAANRFDYNRPSYEVRKI